MDSVTPAPLYADEKNRFEAAKMCYQQHVALLSTMTRFDLQIITGYLSIQFLVVGWAAKPPLPAATRLGLSLVDLALLLVAFVLLLMSRWRRKEVAGVVWKLNDALGFAVEGVYLGGRTVQRNEPVHYWWPWYVLAMISSASEVALIIWWPR